MSNADDVIQGLPAHLRDDAPHWQCSGCGRKSWAARDVGSACAMPQPSGQTCAGRFLAPQPAPSGDETDEEFHAHCLNLTVDEARLICECGSGMRTHVFGGHRSCEYFEHHCDDCHERGICTAHVPVLSKLLALVPVPGAPTGDEAKVRAKARAEAESIASRWVPARMTARQGMVDDITASLVRYRALGRDDARRGSEGT